MSVAVGIVTFIPQIGASAATASVRPFLSSQTTCVKKVIAGADELLPVLSSSKFGNDIIAMEEEYGEDNPIFLAIKDIVTSDDSLMSQYGAKSAEREVPSQADQDCELIVGASSNPSATTEPSQHPAGVANFNIGEDVVGVSCQDFGGWERVSPTFSDASSVEDRPGRVGLSVFTGYGSGNGWGSDPGLEVGFKINSGLASPGADGAVIYEVEVYQNRHQEEGGLGAGSVDLAIVHKSDGWTANAGTATKTSPIPQSAINVDQTGDVGAVFPFSVLSGLRTPFYWTAQETIVDLGVNDSSGKVTGGTAENFCPQKPGSFRSEYPESDYLRFPASSSAPEGRGAFRHSGATASSITSSMKRAMGQGWPPFSDFQLNIQYDSDNKTYALVYVANAPGFQAQFLPGSAVLHENQKRQWSIVAGLGDAYSCGNVPNSVINAFGIGQSPCTTGGTGPLAAPTSPSSSTTSTTNVPVQSSAPPADLGPPLGDGSPWQQAVPALVTAIKDSAAGDPNQPLVYVAGTTFWASQDPKSQDWYYVEALAPSSDLSAPNGAGFAENINGSWTIVSALSDQAPGCFGPEYQELPAGTAGIPPNIASDFTIQC